MCSGCGPIGPSVEEIATASAAQTEKTKPAKTATTSETSTSGPAPTEPVTPSVAARTTDTKEPVPTPAGTGIATLTPHEQERTSLVLLCYALRQHYALFSEYFDGTEDWEPDLDDRDHWPEYSDALNFSLGAIALRDSVDSLPVGSLQATHRFLIDLKQAYEEASQAFSYLALNYDNGSNSDYRDYELRWDEFGRLWEQAWEEWEHIGADYDFGPQFCDRTDGHPTLTGAHDETGTLPLGEVMEIIERQVSALRGWQLIKEPERRLMTREELRDYNEENFLADNTAEEIADDTRTLVALDLVEPGFDLYEMYLDYRTEGILGFYDNDEDVMVGISELDHLDEVGRSTHAHEYQHVLQFHNNDMEAIGYSDDGWEEDSERAAAIKAVIEGEASLVERLWRNATFTVDEYEAEMELYLEMEGPAETPRWHEDQSRFPYGSGYNFVAYVYSAGGWPAVDKLYESPPLSTEMIMHPEKYWEGDNPIKIEPIDLAGALGDQWREFESNVMGEFWTYLILREHISDYHARFAAAGWGGDSYAVAHNDDTDQTTLAIHWEWDTAGDADEFSAAFLEYNDARFGSKVEAYSTDTKTCWIDKQVSCVFTRDARTLWVIGPSIEIVDSLSAFASPA